MVSYSASIRRRDGATLGQTSSRKMAQRLLEYTTKHYSESGGDSMKVLRQRLVQAGIFDQRAVAVFFLVRTTLAIALATTVFFVVPMIRPLRRTGTPSNVVIGGWFGGKP